MLLLTILSAHLSDKGVPLEPKYIAVDRQNICYSDEGAPFFNLPSAPSSLSAPLTLRYSRFRFAALSAVENETCGAITHQAPLD